MSRSFDPSQGRVPRRAAAFDGPAAPGPHPRSILGLQQAAGNDAVQRLLLGRETAPGVVQRIGDFLTDDGWTLGYPFAQATTSPERRNYELSQSKLEEFKNSNHPTNPAHHSPSTGWGGFHAQYWPKLSQLIISVPCKLDFVEDGALDFAPDMERAKQENRAPVPVKDMWTNDQRVAVSTKFFETVNTGWSYKFKYYCHKDWWESLWADAIVVFYEAPGEFPGGPDLTVHFYKGMGVERDNVRHANLHMNPQKEGESKAIHDMVAVHEAGHVLGFEDEYAEKPEEMGKPTAQSRLVAAEFGHSVIRGQADPRSIMNAISDGNGVMPEHGVTFLEALRKVTGFDEWHMTPATPKEVPPPPA